MSRKPNQDAIASRLQHLGIPLEYDKHETSPSVLIRQSGGAPENSVFTLPCGATGVILNICITSDLSKFAISFFELGLPWSDPNFRWLDDPAEVSSARGSDYCFPGTELCFGRELVLNHRANICKILKPGHSIEGLLLGFGHVTIPRALHHGMNVPAFLTVVDQFEEQYSQEVNLYVDRAEELTKRKGAKSRRRPLFDELDAVPDSAPAIRLKI